MLLKLLVENFTIFVHLNEMKLRAYLCLVLSHFLTHFEQILIHNLLKFLWLHFIHNLLMGPKSESVCPWQDFPA
jgi:hypothetical protein